MPLFARKQASGGLLRGREISWPLVAAAAVGIAVAVAATLFLLRFAAERQPTAVVPVPRRDIAPYTEIAPGDLEWRTIPANGFEPGAVRDPGQIVGRLSLAPLYRGEQIRAERLAPKGFAPDVQLVTVNVDLTRSGGGEIRPGDLVDVYWLTGDQAPAALVARDARVVEFLDAQGRPAGREPAPALLSGQVSQPALPAIVTLAVRPEEVGQLVRGAWHDSKAVVLVKKFRPQVPAVVPGQTQPAQVSPEGGGSVAP